MYAVLSLLVIYFIINGVFCTVVELKESIEKLVLERDHLASQVDDLKQITEAAKRERVLAIDEKDHLLRE